MLYSILKGLGDEMKSYKKALFGSLIVGLASQFYINFYISNFKFSLAGVAFPLFLYFYNDINPMFFGLASGVSLFLFRVFFHVIINGIGGQIFTLFLPEAIFYIFYGILFYIGSKKIKDITINRMFLVAMASDFLGNMLEVYIRIGVDLFTKDYLIIETLILVAVARAGITWAVILVYKYYKLFIIKEEHEERYKRLLWLTSRLKTEIYWMEKNMDHIEKVMSNAYELFLKINNKEEEGSWTNRALEISKDVHEIKKEYSLVVRGIEEIIENRLDNKGMHFHELMIILKESMSREVKYHNKDIVIEYKLGKDFYTEKHYFLMSILRNMIMNSIDAIESRGTIKFIHYIEEQNHIFIVTDNGCGIEGEDLIHIFSPGYSTKIDYITGQVNRGLGLSLIQNIVSDNLKGDVYVYSEKNKGTTFEISIPMGELEGIIDEDFHIR